MTLEEFITKYTGKGIDFDGVYSTQCVDLYRQYVKEVLGFPQSPPVEGAKDIWTTYLPEYYDRIEKTPYNQPEKGDIVIWGDKIGKWGHVAIFIEGDNRKFKSFDQNFPIGSLCHIQEHTYNGVIGWLRPKYKKIDMPEWLKTLIQEANLSLDREGEFRAFWEKAKRYDDDIRELQERVKSLSDALADRALEVSTLTEQIQKLRDRVEEFQNMYNSIKQERDQLQFELAQQKLYASSLEDLLKKKEDDLQKMKNIISQESPLYTYSWWKRLLSLFIKLKI